MSSLPHKVISTTVASLLSIAVCTPFAYAETGYFDEDLDKEITLSQWKDSNRDLEDITVFPSHLAQSQIDDYQNLECADFSVEAPQGWGSFYNSSTGVVGVIPPEDVRPGDYDVKVVDSSECFPQDTYTTTMKVHVEKPSIQYRLDDKGTISGEMYDGSVETLGNIHHDNSFGGNISSVENKENGIAVIEDGDGFKHTVYAHKNYYPSYKDNESKGIVSLDIKDNKATIEATDGSVYVVGVESGENDTQAGIADMGVIGKGKLYVTDTAGTSYDLGAIQSGDNPGINSISYNKTIGIEATTTAGKDYYLSKDDGVSSISVEDKRSVDISTTQGKESSLSLEKNKDAVGFENNDPSPRNIGDPHNGGVFKRNGYTYNPVEKDQKENHTLWEKIVNIFL